MSNGYERETRREHRRELRRGGYGRQLSNYEKVLQEEIFALPAYEIENFLEASPFIVKKYEYERDVENGEIHDYDPDEFDLISEYGEDPYDVDGDFSESELDKESIFFVTDKKTTNRLSIAQSEERCDIVFSMDKTGYWDIISHIPGKLRFFTSLPESPYEGDMIIHFLQKRYDILMKISKYLASLMEQKNMVPSEKNRKYFFLYYPEFTSENIMQLDKENIHKSTLSRLNNALLHIPIIGDIRLGEILDITRNAETHGKVINLIDNEDKMNPLKDTQIAEKIGTTDRTIKYIREKYGILNVYQRKNKGEKDE